MNINKTNSSIGFKGAIKIPHDTSEHATDIAIGLSRLKDVVKATSTFGYKGGETNILFSNPKEEEKIVKLLKFIGLVHFHLPHPRMTAKEFKIFTDVPYHPQSSKRKLNEKI